MQRYYISRLNNYWAFNINFMWKFYQSFMYRWHCRMPTSLKCSPLIRRLEDWLKPRRLSQIIHPQSLFSCLKNNKTINIHTIFRQMTFSIQRMINNHCFIYLGTLGKHIVLYCFELQSYQNTQMPPRVWYNSLKIFNCFYR